MELDPQKLKIIKGLHFEEFAALKGEFSCLRFKHMIPDSALKIGYSPKISSSAKVYEDYKMQATVIEETITIQDLCAYIVYLKNQNKKQNNPLYDECTNEDIISSGMIYSPYMPLSSIPTSSIKDIQKEKQVKLQPVSIEPVNNFDLLDLT